MRSSVHDHRACISAALFLCVLLLFAPGAAQARVDGLLSEEAVWVHDHPRVRVGTGSEWAPFDFALQGQWRGLSRDYLEAVARELGLTLEFVPSQTWSQAKEHLLSGQIDLLPAVYHDDDLRSCHFTDPYFNVKEYLFVRDGENPASLENLIGRRVAFVRGSNTQTVVHGKYPGIRIVAVDTIAEALNLVLTGQADGYIDALGAVTHVIRQQGLAGVSVAFAVNLVDTRLRMACGPDKARLCRMLNKALHGLTHAQRQDIDQRWILRPEPSRKVMLTPEEQVWLSASGPIRHRCTANWAPISFFDADGVYQGILAEYLHLVGERTGLVFASQPAVTRAQARLDLQRGQTDMIDVSAASPVLRESMELMRLDVALENVIVTREANLALHNLEQCGGM